MKDADAKVQASCPMCGNYRQVDYDRLIAAKGRGFSLVGRRVPCSFTPGCKGWIKFHYLNGVYRPLWEDRHVAAWMEADSLRYARGCSA